MTRYRVSSSDDSIRLRNIDFDDRVWLAGSAVLQLPGVRLTVPYERPDIVLDVVFVSGSAEISPAGQSVLRTLIPGSRGRLSEVVGTEVDVPERHETDRVLALGRLVVFLQRASDRRTPISGLVALEAGKLFHEAGLTASTLPGTHQQLADRAASTLTVLTPEWADRLDPRALGGLNRSLLLASPQSEVANELRMRLKSSASARGDVNPVQIGPLDLPSGELVFLGGTKEQTELETVRTVVDESASAFVERAEAALRSDLNMVDIELFPAVVDNVPMSAAALVFAGSEVINGVIEIARTGDRFQASVHVPPDVRSEGLTVVVLDELPLENLSLAEVLAQNIERLARESSDALAAGDHTRASDCRLQAIAAVNQLGVDMDLDLVEPPSTGGSYDVDLMAESNPTIELLAELRTEDVAHEAIRDLSMLIGDVTGAARAELARLEAGADRLVDRQSRMFIAALRSEGDGDAAGRLFDLTLRQR